MRGAAPALPVSSFFIILISAQHFVVARDSSNLLPRANPLNIDYDPAPAPEDGAPLSASALRDKSYLPAEIGGIVGAYVLVVSCLLVALFFVGRRLRREREANAQRDVEMLENTLAQKAFYPSPISPTSGLSRTKNFSWPSPDKNDPNPYIFPSTHGSPVSPGGINRIVDTQVVEANREGLQRGLEDLYAHVMEQEEAKLAGRNIADMPPPEPLASTSPQKSKSSKRLEKPKSLQLNSEKPHSRTASIISSIKSPRKKGLRGINISSPIPTPLSSTFPTTYASDEEPLTPRHYQPPPPPPVPNSARGTYHSHSHSRNASTADTSADPSPVSPSNKHAEDLPGLRPLGPAPNNRSIGTSRPPNLRIPGPLRGHPVAAQPSTTSASAASSTRQLPFRAYDPPPGLSSPAFSHTTKTTVLERTTPLSPGGGLRTPFTAGAVPYSPYQPFTPLMPITPRLVTREDRKAMRRLEPKSPVMEMVKSEDELWDSAY
jgi:hypothetical protein